jgi:hypothetical protein
VIFIGTVRDDGLKLDFENDGFVRVQLHGLRGNGLTAIIDESDAASVAAHKWNVSAQGYPVTRIGGNKVLLHRFLMGSNGTLVIDHVNREKLDNRRVNLRWVTRAVNNANVPTRSHCKAGAKGVRRYDGPMGTKWIAQIRINGKVRQLGSYATIAAAEAAVVAMHRQIYGGSV